MRKRKLYLETSVWNFFHVEDDLTKRDQTRRFFETLSDSHVHVSEAVLDEFADAPPAREDQLLALIRKYKPEILSVTTEAEELAQAYVVAAALPPGSWMDAVHVACATVSGMDAIVSWNLRHIANFRRQEKVHAVNYANRYTRLIQLITPLELLEP